MTYAYGADLDRVVDGDTVVLVVDLGFRLTATMPMRLYGLNCAEHGTPAGDAATAWTTQWFVDHPGPVSVVTQKNPEKYGRWLATIASGSDVLNSQLVAEGHALPWNGKGPRPV